MRKRFGALFLFMLVLALTGCGKKASMSIDTFRPEMEKYGLEVIDQTEMAAGDGSYKEVYVATDENRYSFEYYVMEDDKAADSLYTFAVDGLAEVYAEDESVLIEDTSDGKTGRYELCASDCYYTVWKEKNMLIYLTSYIENKEEAQEIMKHLGF